MLFSELPGGGEQLVLHGAAPGLEATPLGRCQALVGQAEVGERLERRLGSIEPLLDARAERSERRGAALLGSHRGERLGQQPAPLGVALSHAIRREQGQRLLERQPVPLARGGQRLLLLGLESAERVGQGHADLPGVDSLRHLGREPLGQGQAVEHPPAFPAADLGDGRGPESVLVAQGEHHAGLVHRRERARGSVGEQQRGLGLGARARPLDHHGHALQAERPPARQALEPVEHLEGVVVRRHHAQGQLTELGVRAERLAAAAQDLQARAQRLERHEAHARAPAGLACRAHRRLW